MYSRIVLGFTIAFTSSTMIFGVQQATNSEKTYFESIKDFFNQGVSYARNTIRSYQWYSPFIPAKHQKYNEVRMFHSEEKDDDGCGIFKTSDGYKFFIPTHIMDSFFGSGVCKNFDQFISGLEQSGTKLTAHVFYMLCFIFNVVTQNNDQSIESFEANVTQYLQDEELFAAIKICTFCNIENRTEAALLYRIIGSILYNRYPLNDALKLVDNNLAAFQKGRGLLLKSFKILIQRDIHESFISEENEQPFSNKRNTNRRKK